MRGERLDVLLVNRGLAPSRERARAYILEGRVFVGGLMVTKAGSRFSQDSELTVRGDAVPFASRGGLKLEKALDEFGVQVAGKSALDCGASTGGFTDCLLGRGAARVYAVDVGYGQLAWDLRNDPRVIVLERTNLRYLTPERLGERVDVVTLDVSFISLRKVWPAVNLLVAPGGEVLSLVKPQFEAGRGRVGKRGVVKDPAVHLDVLRSLCDHAIDLGFGVAGTCFSPVKGAQGNIEFWIHMYAAPACGEVMDRLQARESAALAVAAAHEALGGRNGREEKAESRRNLSVGQESPQKGELR
ncbi:MAG: TlyA family RNA methyltransferase [Bacillota bacterium]